MYWESCFWTAALVVAYAYVLYPLLIAALASRRPSPSPSISPATSPVSIVIAARDEGRSIVRRMDEVRTLLSTGNLAGELILISDGSTDDTASAARQAAGPDVTVIEFPNNQGKAAALNAGVAAARHPIVVFADVRQTWAPDALSHLLKNFADPAVGAVGGELLLQSRPGVMAGVGLYWRFEKWLRRRESRLHSTVGLTGAICAVRRDLFRPIPRGTILDDVYWPLRVCMQGRRVVHEPAARAFDQLPTRARDEFRRKVRTLSGNFQLLTRLPSALLPWRNPVWLQFLSHKVLRLLGPWLLLALLVSSAVLPGPFYRAALCLQIAFYLLALLGIGVRSRLASAAASFLVLNAAAWLAFWVWATGNAGNSWKKIRYTHR